ncbi:MAG: hypothetical protein PHC61_19380 [Chitinivibrionales bacterium]|nr:hypothetical protein [Chitinivibrionales bacterium]
MKTKTVIIAIIASLSLCISANADKSKPAAVPAATVNNDQIDLPEIKGPNPITTDNVIEPVMRSDAKVKTGTAAPTTGAVLNVTIKQPDGTTPPASSPTSTILIPGQGGGAVEAINPVSPPNSPIPVQKAPAAPAPVVPPNSPPPVVAPNQPPPVTPSPSLPPSGT